MEKNDLNSARSGILGAAATLRGKQSGVAAAGGDYMANFLKQAAKDKGFDALTPAAAADAEDDLLDAAHRVAATHAGGGYSTRRKSTRRKSTKRKSTKRKSTKRKSTRRKSADKKKKTRRRRR